MSSKQDAVRVWVADRSPLYRQGVRLLLNQPGATYRFEEVTHYQDLCQALNLVSGQQGDGAVQLLIIDRILPGLMTPDQLATLALRKNLKILVMAELLDEAFVRLARSSGAQGVISKAASVETFRQVVEALLAGRQWYQGEENSVDAAESMKLLSAKQRLVLEMLQQGLMNKQIAAKLELGENTVKYHVTQIYRTLNFDKPNRTKLATSGAYRYS